MANWNLIISIFFVLIFVLVILSISLPGVIKFVNDEANRDSLKNVSEAQRMMCGIPSELDLIFDMMGSISSDSFDNKAKGIYQSILWGNDVESCDVLYLYQQLDIEQKKKLNWMELSCTVSHCIAE